MQLGFKKAGGTTDMEMFKVTAKKPKHNQGKKEHQQNSGNHYYDQL